MTPGNVPGKWRFANGVKGTGSMRMKILFAVVALAVFVGGPALRSYIRQTPQSDQPQSYATQGPAPVVYSAPQPAEAGANTQTGSETTQSAAPEHAPEADNSSQPAARQYDSQPAYRNEPAPRRVRRQSLEHQALIIGGTAAAGSAIGAAAGGGKGAAVGALSGGAAGLAYELLTRNQ